MGILEKSERFGRVIPLTNESVTIKNILKRELMHKGIILETEIEIKEIKKNDKIFELFSENKTYLTSNLVISTGGYSYPSIGTTGDGFKFAKQFNHSINKSYPVLVPIELKNNPFTKLQGIKMDVNIFFQDENKIVRTKFGEILFTDYGISGPAAIDISLPYIAESNTDNKLYLNFLSGHKATETSQLIKRYKTNTVNFNLKDFFSGILPQKFINRFLSKFLNKFSLTLETKINKIDEKLFSELIHELKNFEITILKFKSFKEARTCYGGIPDEEISPLNFESQLIPNLFFTGEMINISGLSGGYNLQFAFSSGFIAGNYLKSKTTDK